MRLLISIPMKYLVTALSLLVSASSIGAQTAINSRVTEFELQDQFDNKPVNIRQYEGKIVVIIASDREGANQNEEWENALIQRDGNNLALLRIADLRGVPAGLWKNRVKKKFQEEKRSILLDWDGVIFTRYGLTKNVSNVILIDRAGYIRFICSGAATNATKDRLFNEINKLEQSR